jgi:hypothetical protein
MGIAKKMGFAVIFLALSLTLGIWLTGLTDVVLGQDLAQRFVVAVPSDSCALSVQSEIFVAEDGSGNAQLIATAPSPCGLMEFEIVSFPAETARCFEKGDGTDVIVACDFTERNETTLFMFSSNADY